MSLNDPLPWLIVLSTTLARAIKSLFTGLTLVGRQTVIINDSGHSQPISLSTPASGPAVYDLSGLAKPRDLRLGVSQIWFITQSAGSHAAEIQDTSALIDHRGKWQGAIDIPAGISSLRVVAILVSAVDQVLINSLVANGQVGLLELNFILTRFHHAELTLKLHWVNGKRANRPST